MPSATRARDLGLVVGELPTGRLDKISDVPGVSVGHCTVAAGDSMTGATAVMPVAGNVFSSKLRAASAVLNGYGKSTGLIQIAELGLLESPILLVNTLNVGLAADALVEHQIRECAREALELTSFNPVVCECNDSYLNDIRLRAVGRDQVFAAIADARADFEEGDVGAGKGMSCHGLKGGIGSASRKVRIEGRDFVLGALVLANHGRLEDLTVLGRPLGKELRSRERNLPEKGSVIIVIATDMPLSDRQLGRACRRSVVGLSHVGSYLGHGSGDIAIGFSTAYPVRRDESREILDARELREDRMDAVFRAVAESVEESVLNAMIAADPVAGYKGHSRESLRNILLAGAARTDGP
ncbi:MAG: P1 family peptidase [Spirochaetaceae bacterium]|nr:P1 family peptidase [Spirochaetaceae bacterium]